MSRKELNLKTIDKLTETSFWRNLLTLGGKLLQGAGSGLGTGALVISILATAGISVALIFEIIAASAGAAILGFVALGFSAYHLWKERRRIEKSKIDFDEKLKLLRSSIIESLKQYELTHELINTMEEELNRLHILVAQITNDAEKKRVAEKIEELEADLQLLKKKREEIILHFKIACELVTGDSTLEKLSHLFNATSDEGKNAIKRFASGLNLQDTDLRKIDSALNKIWSELDKPLGMNGRVPVLKANLAALTLTEKEKTSEHVKRGYYALTAFGGFIGGVGLGLTIAAIAVGGIAALSVVGWPVVVGLIGAGLVTMVAALVYYHYIEKRQQKVSGRLNRATGQVAGMNSYLTHHVNNDIKNEVSNVYSNYLELGKRTSQRLDEHRINLDDIVESINRDLHDVHHLESESRHFKTYEKTQLEGAINLNESLKNQRAVLQNLKERISTVTVIAHSEEQKTELLAKVDEYIVKVEDGIHSVNSIKFIMKQSFKLKSTTESKESKLKSIVDQDSSENLTPPLKPKDEDSEGEGEGPNLENKKSH